ncbi:TolC family protein [Cupriavidus consociatus]|uniref:TolC family protein n=1 Tax=Cupriavidus consociatus TaxID=2821357 RepID=UPI001AE51661|nr:MULTISPECIES: TolC family protein [unclassified Cupriavidus]MBP0625094.1 TolC family protein [Cupriavidus sp. LEh25]MDK2661832.1 TolC family protein [Cupriavidus sp. LEh21]
MNSERTAFRGLFLPLALTVIALSGCAGASLEQSLSRTNEEAASFTGGQLALAKTQEDENARKKAATELLARPLGQEAAVQLALANSPALQALLAQHAADTARAAKAGRLPNPIFSLQRLRVGDVLELDRMISIGLLDLLTLPLRQQVAGQQIEQERLRLTSDVVDQVSRVRQAWVRAVAAQQSLKYAGQVYESAEASAELSRRMQAVGNFSKLQRARQQAFYADAGTQLAVAHYAATAAREELVRQLGLTEGQAQELKLPERLPDLPREPLQPAEVGQTASRGRLDVRLAQAQFDTAARDRGLVRVTSITDIELGGIRNTISNGADGSKATERDYEFALRLPLFDWGDLQRDAANGQVLASAQRLDATLRAAGSSLRQSYAAYRTTYDIARHQRDEVVPLRKTISDENLLRYNGMLIGVFDLLADAREQVNAVMAEISAEQQFWLADAALRAELIGRPMASPVTPTSSATAGSADTSH